jgi:antitoxin (DNA-binding transcriptional repressor) of toxin-antitoxin stability system
MCIPKRASCPFTASATSGGGTTRRARNQVRATLVNPARRCLHDRSAPVLDRGRRSWLDLAMKTVRIATLKDELSMHIRAVEGGASYIVTDRNRPVAQLLPLPSRDEEACEVLAAECPFSRARERKFKATKKTVDSLALLQAERGKR